MDMWMEMCTNMHHRHILIRYRKYGHIRDWWRKYRSYTISSFYNWNTVEVEFIFRCRIENSSKKRIWRYYFFFSEYQCLVAIYHFVVQALQPEHTWGTLLLVSAVDEETRRRRLCWSRVSVCIGRCDELRFFQHEELWRLWRSYQRCNRRSWIKTSSTRNGPVIFEKVRCYCWITSREFVKKMVKK